MQNHNGGYVVDLPYENFFFKDLTPNYLRMLLLLKGIDLPHREDGEPFRYLELGYGQGISLNVHAASNAGEFWGTDFNPEHSISAKKALSEAHTKVQVLNDSFFELEQKCNNGLLPQYDIIVMHGIWSWISPENQRCILAIVSKNLKAGGAVYVSYNAMPGWAAFLPVRELLSYHAASQSSSSSSSVSKIQGAYSLLSNMEKGGASYFTHNPAVAQKFKDLEKQSFSYVAHEYLNQNWDIPYFKDVATAFESAKCSFITSTRPLTELAFSFTPEIASTLNETTDVKLRETLRDFALNTQFRCDIYVKGKNSLNPQDWEKKFFSLKLALVCQASAVTYSIASPRGTIQCKQDMYEPLVKYLAEDSYQAKSMQDIKNQESYKDMAMSNFLEIIRVMLAAGFIHPAQDIAEQQQNACKHINTFFCQEATKTDYSKVLASPLLGGGVQVSNIEQIFLNAKAQGHTSPTQCAEFTHKLLIEQKRQIIINEKKLSEEESLKHLIEIANTFEKTRLPLLQALGIYITANVNA